MGFGMMRGKGPGKKEMKPASKKAPMKKGPGNPMNTMGGKGAMSKAGNNEKMPGAKQAEMYTKNPAPSDAGIRAQKKMLPPGKMPIKGKK